MIGPARRRKAAVARAAVIVAFVLMAAGSCVSQGLGGPSHLHLPGAAWPGRAGSGQLHELSRATVANPIVPASNIANTLIATVPVGVDPLGVAFDSANGDVFAANEISDNVSVISGSTNTVVASVPVGYDPYRPVYDSSNGDVYVSNGGSDSVSVISGSGNALVATVAVGAAPQSPAYDSANGDLYVSNFNSGSVSVISGFTNTVVATLPVGSPMTPAYDPANGDIYVPSWNSDTISVISGLTNTVVALVTVGSGPDTPVYDSANGEVYVANFVSNDVSVISGSKSVGTLPVGVAPFTPAFDTANGDLYVPDSGSSNVTVISGSTNTVVGPVKVGSGPGTPAYDAANGDVYVPDLNSDNVSVISGETNAVVATVPVGSNPFPPVFDNTNGNLYVPNEGSGNVSVITCGYSLTFTERGLGWGNWSISLAGSTMFAPAGLPIVFGVTNGTWHYTVGAIPGLVVNPSIGTVQIQGRSETVTVTFSLLVPPPYVVVFNETGLAPGTYWNVSLNGSMRGSTGTSIVYQVAIGPYSFSVGPVPGYTRTPTGGSVTVLSGPVFVSIAYTPASGWLNGTVNPSTAIVTIGGSPITLSGGTFNLSLLPGLYSVVATAPNRAPYYNNVSVLVGKSTVLAINLASPSAAVSTPQELTYAIGGLGGGAAGGIAVGYIVGHRRKLISR